MTQPQQFQQGMTISLLLLVLLVLTTTNCCYFAFAAPTQEATIDYTCDIYKDWKCPTTQDGVCDNPNHGGSGGDDCLNQDCIDCIGHCQQFDADCYGCINAKGCYYRPGDEPA